MSRITFVLTSNSLGGAELFTVRLAEALAVQDAVRVVGLAGSPVLMAARDAGLDTAALDLGEKLGLKTAVRNAGRFRSARRRLDAFMAAESDDLFVLQFKWEELLWAGRHSRDRVALLEHGPVPRNLLRLRWARKRLRRALVRARAVYAVSDPAAESIRSISGREPSPLMAGVDADAATAAVEARPATRASLGLAREARNLLFLGRVTEDKGILDCVRLVPEVDDAVLTVCGEGPAAESAKALAGELGVDDRVNWVGWTDRPYEMIAAADAMLLLSSSPGEGRPLTVLEAAAVGTPTVGLDSSPALVAISEDAPVRLAGSSAPEAVAPVVESVLAAPRIPRAEQSWADTAAEFRVAIADRPAAADGWRSSIHAYGSVVVLSTADFDAPLWTNKQHIASRLAEEVPVLYVESLGLRRPRLSARDVQRVWKRIAAIGKRSDTKVARPIAPDIEVVAPIVIPWHRSKSVRGLNRRLFSLQVGQRIEDLPQPVLLWAYSPLAADIVDHAKFERVLFHCVDDLTSVPGIDAESVDELQTALAQASDLVVVTARALLDRFEQVNEHTVLRHNVVDVAHFAKPTGSIAEPPSLAPIPRPRAVFSGALSGHKIDWPLLRDAAGLLPEWNFVLVGPAGEEQRQDFLGELGRVPNIHWLGARNYDELPGYLWAADVGLIPYRLTDHTAAIFPMKTLEYMSAGLPVVATPLPAVVEAIPDGLSVETASDAKQFAEAIRRAEPGAGDAAYLAANTWDELLRAILDELAAAPASMK